MITEARSTSGGPFLSVTDFCLRVDMRKVNRKVLEALIKAGAFDGIAAGRRGLAGRNCFPPWQRHRRARPRPRRNVTLGRPRCWGLFGGGTAASPQPNQDVFGEGEEWTPKEVLAFEKESLGFYISGHPLGPVCAAN